MFSGSTHYNHIKFSIKKRQEYVSSFEPGEPEYMAMLCGRSFLHVFISGKQPLSFSFQLTQRETGIKSGPPHRRNLLQPTSFTAPQKDVSFYSVEIWHISETIKIQTIVQVEQFTTKSIAYMSKG